MIELLNTGAYLVNGIDIIPDTEEGRAELKARTGAVPCPANAAKETIAYGILKDHNVSGNMENLQIKFDKLTSHDITFVGIIQTARASGLEKFPVPYVLTNCHNSLCAVGGTINEDDHMFGLTCAKKYGGVYVPPHQAVIHQFAREMLAGGGKMILGSDSHTRYGAPELCGAEAKRHLFAVDGLSGSSEKFDICIIKCFQRLHRHIYTIDSCMCQFVVLPS